MKIEAVDKRNPVLIRVATVTEVDGHLLKLHFDEWDECYDYWVEDDCSDIHPAGWCHKTGHPLTAPPSEFQISKQYMHPVAFSSEIFCLLNRTLFYEVSIC